MYKDWVKQNVFNNGKLNPRASTKVWWEKNNSLHIWDDIDQAVRDLPVKSFNEKIYCYLNDIKTIPLCAGCRENPVNFNRGDRLYSTYCSARCASKYTQDKKVATSIERYGYVKNFSSSEHKTAVANTCFEKYGTDNPSKLAEIKEKIKNSQLKKYGSYFTQTAEYNNKRATTSLKKYGETSHMKLQYYKNQTRLINLKVDDAIVEKIIAEYTSGIPKQQVAKNVGLSLSHLNKVLIKLNLETDLPQNKIAHITKQSKFELEVLEFIQNNYRGTIETSKRKYIGSEIDIFLPDLNIGFECNGTYWHSDHYKHKNYHLDKTTLAESVGIHLIHITDYDWYVNHTIISNMILSKLNLLQETVFARKCKIAPISSQTSMQFENAYHIQGYRTAKHRFGLFMNDKLCASMTFNTFRDGVEIARYVTSMSVPGGFSKLLAHSGFDTIYSYANRSYTNRMRNVYLSNGFVEIELTKPNYAYYTGLNKIARTSAMKNKLHFLKDFDKELSESENMRQNGYYRMWDSGNILYKKVCNAAIITNIN